MEQLIHCPLRHPSHGIHPRPIPSLNQPLTLPHSIDRSHTQLVSYTKLSDHRTDLPVLRLTTRTLCPFVSLWWTELLDCHLIWHLFIRSNVRQRVGIWTLREFYKKSFVTSAAAAGCWGSYSYSSYTTVSPSTYLLARCYGGMTTIIHNL